MVREAKNEIRPGMIDLILDLVRSMIRVQRCLTDSERVECKEMDEVLRPVLEQQRHSMPDSIACSPIRVDQRIDSLRDLTE
jgi:hypothetical protein